MTRHSAPEKGVWRSLRRSWPARWAWWGVRWLAYAVALYGCLFLLLTVGTILDAVEARQDAGIRVDSIQLIAGEYHVRGEARRSSLIEAGTRHRTLGYASSKPSGEFVLELRSPFPLNELLIRVIDPKTGEEIGTREVPFSRLDDVEAPLSLDVAYYISDAGRLWVAGRSQPFESVSILAGDGSVLASAGVDFSGVYDELIPLTAPPQRVSASRGTRRSRPVAVGSYAAAGLPVARKLTIDESGSKAKLSIAVTLPVSHPLFAGASQGFFPAERLVTGAFGFMPLRLKGPAVYEVVQGQGTVRIEEEIPSLPLFQLWSAIGIGSMPLLSPQDQVSVVFGKNRPKWFGEVPPTELTDRGATWRGPVRGTSPTVVEFGSSRPVDLSRGSFSAKWREQVPDSEREAELEAERLRQFIRGFDQGAANPFQQLWRTAILLIPFAGFLLVARRTAFGRPEAWRLVGAAALVLAAWRCWNLLYSLLLAGPAPWISRAVAWPLGVSRESTSLQSVAQSLTQTGPSAFWLLFVSLVALVPLYFDNVARAATQWRPPARRRRSWPSRAWTVLKIAFGALVLGTLFFSVRQATREPRILYETIQPWIGTSDGTLVVGSAILALGCLFLAVSGLRGLLVGLVVLLTNLSWIAQSSAVVEDLPDRYRSWAETLASVPAEALLVLAGLAFLPALSRLLDRLVPFTPGERRLRWLVAALLAAVCLLLPDLPIRWTLAVSGALLAVGLGWLATQVLSRNPAKRPAAWWSGPPSWTAAGLALAGFAVGWPFPQPNGELRLSNLGRLMGELGQLFPWVLALGVVLLLLEHARKSPDAILPKDVLRLGAYLYVIFVINSSRTWLLVPVPLLVGLALAAGWLFRPAAETGRLKRMLPARRRTLRELLAHVLGSVESADLLRSIRKSLTGKLEKAEIEPAEYERQMAVYRQYVEGKAARPAIASRQSLRKLVFTVGYSILKANTRAALGAGALLALAPLSIALYRYLPHEKVVHPYPLANLLVFLVGAIASWLLYAFFFGYFFAHLRGDTGLAKGIHLFSLVVLPFAVLHLLDTSTWEEMRPFLLWASQVFLFCSLLGLIAFDYGLLRRKGYAARDLRRVHDLPALSAYASTALAAIIPAILAVVTGRLTDLVSFFLNTILPRVPAP